MQKINLKLNKKKINIDGVVKIKNPIPFKKNFTPTIVRVNSRIIKKPVWFKNFNFTRQVSIVSAVLGLFLAFLFGGLAVLNTTDSLANNENLGFEENQDSYLGLVSISETASTEQEDNILFNTPIQYLESYFNNIKEPEIINARKQKIEKMLKDRKSPLYTASETIALQEHWKLILAITFAESTLGKNCNDNNCSNIGVAPGHRLWRSYESYNAWVVDFNRLLERRYNNWSLKDMCGVYVQPCNKNWLLATGQILDDIKDREIE